MDLSDYNIVLINLDGFRHDRLDKIKSLSEIRKKSLYFQNMFTVAPYTFASLHAIFSGMYPSKNGVNAYYNILKFKKDEIITLPQYLKKFGYYTACDIISEVVIPQQGFDEWNIFDEKTVQFEQRHKDLLKSLAKKEKFFLFFHYTETHKHLVREIVQKYKQENNDDDFFKNIKENEIRYDSYLPSYDSYINTIIKTLQDEGIYENTILIFFSDHGTSIGEKKGEKFYGVFAYDYSIHVFCIIKIPRMSPKLITNQCRTIDIFPTIIEMAGTKNMNNDIQGESLFSLIDSKVEREVFVETGGLSGPWPSSKKHNVFCVRKNNKKLIYNDTPQTWEYYNLENDPVEKINLINEKINEVTDMKRIMIDYFKKNNIITKLDYEK